MNQNIFSRRTGSIEVFMLAEHQGEGNPGILIDADPSLVKQYLPSGTYRSAVNVFLVRNGKENILIDTGFGGQSVESMKSLGVSPESISAVLITHLHGDHYSGLERDGKALFPAAEIYLAQKEKESGLNVPPKGPGKSPADVFAPYGNRVRTFVPGSTAKPEALLPGISAIAASGHTPGHTVYLIESAGERFLITGDMVHVSAIQFSVPDLSVSYDTDPASARSSRRELLAWAAAGNIPIGGMHLPWPGMGEVIAEDGGYRFAALGEG